MTILDICVGIEIEFGLAGKLVTIVGKKSTFIPSSYRRSDP